MRHYFEKPRDSPLLVSIPAQIAALRARLQHLESSLSSDELGRNIGNLADLSLDSLEGLPDLVSSAVRHDSDRSSGDSSSDKRKYVSHPLLFNDRERDEDDLVCIKREDLELLYLKERAMDVVHEGITIADASLPDMPLIYINDGFKNITGYPVAAVKNKNCRFLQGEGTDQETVTKLRESIKKGEPCVVQLMNYRKDGTGFINNLSVTPIHDQEGKVTHYVGIQSDVTELMQRKQAEAMAKIAASEAAAATEAKSKFLTRMSHEIRTPLNGMIAVSQLLSYSNLTPQQWDLVNTIKCSGDALLSLITDILDFSRIEANKMTLVPRAFYLRSTVEAAMEIAGMHAAEKRLHVGYTIADNVPDVVFADPDRLQQILLNTLNNAVKFTEVGEIFLEISTESFSDAKDREFPVPGDGKTSLHFRVTDTGIGMSDAGIEMLFRSFSQLDNSVSTRKYGGSGLGLHISRKLCKAMGGDIWATSQGPEKGSAFSWYITSENVAKPPKKTTSLYSRTLDVATGKKILLLEENAMVRNVVENALRAWGCEVFSTDSERDAVISLKLIKVREGYNSEERKSGCKGPFDVVIMSVSHKSLFSTLLKDRHANEADRCILLSWPGHVNLTEIDLPIHQSNMAYVTVSRPVRQGRLQIALQEVLSLDTDDLSLATADLLPESTAPQSSVAPANVESESFSKMFNSSSQGSLMQVPRGQGASMNSHGSEPLDCSMNNEEKKLLIVEDNVINMKVAISILKKLGFCDIDTANDGLEAIKKIQEAGGPQVYHVILMDLHMPNMDGVGAVNEIRRLYPKHDTKIIAVTADAFEDTRDMCVANGFGGWLAKPFRVEEFASIMCKDNSEWSSGKII
jgi:PAS domain S-box-containing protein